MDKLLKALDEVVAWFKKEGATAEADVHKALAALHLKHGPKPAPAPAPKPAPAPAPAAAPAAPTPEKK